MRFYGKIILLLPAFFILSGLSAPAFEKAETPLFIFYYAADESRAASFLVKNGDAAARGIAKSLGLAAPKKISVYLVPSFEDFKKAYPAAGHIPVWAAGLAYPGKNIIVLLRRPGIDLIKTFNHELNHILLGQLFNGKDRVPRWLDEGLAMIQADEWSLSRLSTMTAAVLSGSLLPMDALAKSFPADLRDAETAYCQSFYFIAFLKGKFGDEAFRMFLREYSKYGDFKGAVNLAYRIPWEKMEGLWRSYLRLRFSWIPLITSTSTIWFMATLIFIAGYIRKKRAGKKTLRQWEYEEGPEDKSNITYH